MNSMTISEAYLQLQTELHRNPDYGVASLSFAPIVADIINQTGITSISDYGAGKKNLLVGLAKLGVSPSEYFPYDPVFPEYGPPKSADLVCCIDVLEHVEPEKLDSVVGEVASISSGLAFISIHMGPADKTLPDGRNAHLIQKPSSWWLAKLIKHFEIHHLARHQLLGDGIWVIAERKKTHEPILDDI